jgi:hypothetical protein
LLVILEKGLLRAAIRGSVQWGATGSHVVVRVLEVVDRFRG